MSIEKIIDGLKVVRTIHNGNYAPQIDEAIKLLEQENILDKIKAEIRDWQIDIHNNEYDAEAYDYVFERIYEIIDEHKAESEPQDNDIEKRKPCINYEDSCEEWAGCPCVYYKAESENNNG